MQEICESGGDLAWASPQHILNSFSPDTVTDAVADTDMMRGSSSVNKFTNTTTSARPLPDPTHCVQQLRALLPSRPDIGEISSISRLCGPP